MWYSFRFLESFTRVFGGGGPRSGRRELHAGSRRPTENPAEAQTRAG